MLKLPEPLALQTAAIRNDGMGLRKHSLERLNGKIVLAHSKILMICQSKLDTYQAPMEKLPTIYSQTITLLAYDICVITQDLAPLILSFILNSQVSSQQYFYI